MAENFYKRLWNVVDDYGRFEYDPIVLLSKTYPRRVHRYTPLQVEGWMSECADGDEPLVIIYVQGRKTYLQIMDFGQRIRPDSKSKYPAPVLESTAAVLHSPAATRGETPRDSAYARASAPTTSTPPASPSSSGGGEEEGGDLLESKPVDSEPELWKALLFAANSVGMIYAPDELRDIRACWGATTLEERPKAIAGIEIRRDTGEYADPHFVPGLRRFVTKRLWQAPLRPGPRAPERAPPIDFAEQRRKRAAQEFSDVMMEKLKNGQRKIQSG